MMAIERDAKRATGAEEDTRQDEEGVTDVLRALQRQVALGADRVALRYLVDGDPDGAVDVLTYATLMNEAQTLARVFMRHAEPGARVVLMLPSGIGYVVAFFACQYARMIAVPAYPPEGRDMRMSAHVQRLRRVIADCDAKIAVLPRQYGATVGEATHVLDTALQASPLGDGLAMLTTVALDVLPGGAVRAQVSGRPHEGRSTTVASRVSAETVCFLQYTSGSTASPKGVMVSHGNLLANVAALAYAWQCTAADRMFSWLPLYHDMGLIGGLLLPLLHGFPVTLISPAHFLERPSRWLRGIAAERASVSGGPDFAFRLCVDRMRLDADLDLTPWRLAFCGSEPIRQSTMDDFAAHFAPSGFAWSALYPCYGLAEATLIVSGGVAGTGAMPSWFDTHALRLSPARGVRVPDATVATIDEVEDRNSAHDSARRDDLSNCDKADARRKAIVGCGAVVPHHAMRIVGEDGWPLPDGEVGEIWCSGPSIARGYWRNAAATKAAFVVPVFAPASRWLRTGDLGFIEGGQVFLCGRQKDLLIVHGENVYPQDLEAVLADRVTGLRRGRIAVFPVTDMNDVSGEGVGIAAEVPRGKARQSGGDAIIGDIAAVLGEAYRYRSDLILLLEPGDLPRTSSGKLQRSACYPAWRDGTLQPYQVHDRRPVTRLATAQTAMHSDIEGATDAIPVLQRETTLAFASAARAGLRPDSVATASDAGHRWSDTARVIADVWREVLDLDTRGRGDAVPRGALAIQPRSDFFALGGRSLLATRVAARLREATGKRVAVGMLFRHPVLDDLARALDATWSTASDSPSDTDAWLSTPHQTEPTGAQAGSTARGTASFSTAENTAWTMAAAQARIAPLSLQQQRLWVLWQMDPNSPAYNVSAAVSFDGAVPLSQLRDAVDAVVRRHEALRTRFITDDDDQPQQQILPLHAATDAWAWQSLACSPDGLDDAMRDAARDAFDLEAGPLLRVIHHALSSARHVVQFVLHHIVTDGWSVEVMLRDWAQAVRSPQQYAALAPLPVTYADYAVMQRASIGGDGRIEYDRARDYWRARLQDIPRVWPVAPEGVEGGPGSDGEEAWDAVAGRCVETLPASLTTAIARLAREHAVSAFSVYLAALDALLYRDAGHGDLAVAVPIAGREDPRLTSVIGFFVNTLVVRSRVSGTQSFATVLRQVHSDSLQAQAYGAVPFDRVVADVRRDALGGRSRATLAERVGQARDRDGIVGLGATGAHGLDLERGDGTAMPADHPLANPLTQIKLVLHDALPRTLALEAARDPIDGDAPGLTGQVSNADASDARFAIALDLMPSDDTAQPGIEAVFAYAGSLYSADRMARFAADYKGLLTRLCAAPDTVLDAL